MVEIHAGRPETQQQKSNVNAADGAQQNRQAEQKAQRHRPVMPPPDRKKDHTAGQQQHSKEEPDWAEEQPTDGQAQQEASWEEDEFINEMFGGETDEQVNAHNERIKADRKKVQLKKEQLREEALKQYEKYQARLAAMTPEEREAWERRREKIRTPVQPLTPDEFKQLIFKMHDNIEVMQRKKAAWVHKRDPRYDPMTGDLLEPDEHPLSPTSEYYFDGQTRPRRFVPPDSPYLKKYRQLETDEDDPPPENEKNERFVQRLLKAGFVEVEPTLLDKASFERAQWYRSLSPSEKMQLLRESMREMTRGRSFDKKTAGEKVGEKFAKFIELLIDFLMALIDPEMIEKKNRDQPAQKTA